MKIKGKKFLLFGILSFLAILFNYVISYGILLPIFERNHFTKYIAYEVYVPLEYVRKVSYPVYYITEKMYIGLGGNSDSHRRANSDKSIRRDIEWYDNGKIISDSIWQGDELLSSKMFYENGNLKIVLNDSQSQIYYPNGNIAVDRSWEPPIFTKVFSKDGALISEGYYKDHAKYNGTYIKYYPDEDKLKLEIYNSGQKTEELDVSPEFEQEYLIMMKSIGAKLD